MGALLSWCRPPFIACVRSSSTYFVVSDSPQYIVVSYISHPQREMLPWEAMGELGEVNKIGPLI